jgi:protoheme IX farnesyltransferase
LGIRFLQWALVLYRGSRPHAAINTFKCAMYDLMLLFIALLVDHYSLLNS